MCLADAGFADELSSLPVFVDEVEIHSLDLAELEILMAAEGGVVGELPSGLDRAISDCIIVVESDPDWIPAIIFSTGLVPGEIVDLGSLDGSVLLLNSLGIMALAALMAYLVANQVSRPLRSLTDAINRLGQGDLSHRVQPRGGGEIADLAFAFNRMGDDLDRSEQTRSQIVSDVAHELRNSIGVLQDNLEAAQDDLFPIDRELIDLHLSRLVNDLQQLSLIEAGRLLIEPIPNDARDVVGGVLVASLAAETEADVTLTLVPADQAVIVVADPTRLQQVVTDLVNNAITYIPPGCVHGDRQRGDRRARPRCYRGR